MNNFIKNPYEIKREIVYFSKKIYEGCTKPTSKFVLYMQYGLAKSGSCLISNIVRALDENIKLSYMIKDYVIIFQICMKKIKRKSGAII